MVSGEEAEFHERIKIVESHYIFWYVQALTSLRRDGWCGCSFRKRTHISSLGKDER